MTRTSFASALVLVLAASCTPRPGTQEPRTPAADPHDRAPGVVDGRAGADLAATGARVVDVRTPQEYASGHVPGALNIPFDELPRRAAEIGGPETPVVLYCRSGRRSAIAAESLRALGYEKVFDAQRYDTWPRAGAGGG
jgi:phage shock protein E